jgi:hypothetical protein
VVIFFGLGSSKIIIVIFYQHCACACFDVYEKWCDKKALHDLKLQWLLFWAGFDGSIYHDGTKNNCSEWIIPANDSIRRWWMQTFFDVKNGILDAPENACKHKVVSAVQGGKPILRLRINRKGDLRKLAIQMQDLFERKPDLVKFVPAKKLENLKIMSEFDVKDDNDINCEDEWDQFHKDDVKAT